jgi:hypothetical protein
MPIPPLLAAPAILPPFVGASPTTPSGRSPYRVTIEEVVQRFATSGKRCEILSGLLSYRKELRRLHFGAEFQWLAGSFVESPGREPNDVDVVTFYRLSPDQLAMIRSDPQRWRGFQDLMGSAKARFFCDAYFVNMAVPGNGIVTATHYWYGLFSHQRGSLAWKGMLEIEVQSPDDDRSAEDLLGEVMFS